MSLIIQYTYNVQGRGGGVKGDTNPEDKILSENDWNSTVIWFLLYEEDLNKKKFQTLKFSVKLMALFI